MAVPDFQTMMLPFLRFLSDRQEHAYGELATLLAEQYRLSQDERAEMVPSGKQTRLINRVHWISTYFKKAQLVQTASRGTFRITARGLELLSRNPQKIDMKTLEEYPEYIAFRNQKNRKLEKSAGDHEPAQEVEWVESKTPDEILDGSYGTIRANLMSEILEKVKSCSPAFFERLVVELLVSMGYGGTLQDAGAALGRSGDGGIDGIIKEDRLGLDVIYLQAKRWENTVPGKEVREFAGALQWKRAKKGVFITTSDYSKSAREFAGSIDTKIILIDGTELAELMIDYNVGVSVSNTYEIKKIDSDYFVEE
ncbi:MAG TPA: restriction endonuclease [Pyrinomonadaceae bacterium]|nr:restriction endonuclease [Pyrinomonadaceae bacterium]